MALKTDLLKQLDMHKDILQNNSIHTFDPHHEDQIHDSQFDFYGKLLATCSSDKSIRLWQIEGNDKESFITALTGHNGPVWRVAWAHPQFGSILASCSYDGRILIWREDRPGQWIKVFAYDAHEASVNSIAWAPADYGLILSCASSDGKISVLRYDSESMSWNNSIWMAHDMGALGVSWSPLSFGYSIFKSLDKSSLTDKNYPDKIRLATSGCDNLIKIWHGDSNFSNWTLEFTLKAHTDWVRDIAWCPGNNNLLASGSQDKSVLIWQFNHDSTNNEKGSQTNESCWCFDVMHVFPDTIWRLSWNEPGFLLAVSCGDQNLSVWAEESPGKWISISFSEQE